MMIKKVKRRSPKNVDPTLSIYHPKIQQIFAARGVSHSDELDYSLSGLLPPDSLMNSELAAKYLFEAIKKQQSILIIGDFDCDGATSSAVMIKALKLLGATRVNFLVPDRFKFGYGLSVKLVEFAATMKPDLIVTVDNGIANVEGVARANELTIPVIITDHHLAAEQLPDALTIVNPNQPGDQFASKNLAGVGVAFYLMLMLRSVMRQADWFVHQKIDEPNLAELLDIVALGTIADVVVLDKNNRILVEQGLRRIRSGLACPGITALLQVANRDYQKCQASDIGFALGPRLNAAGRLEDMSVGIDCLLAESLEQAIPIAARLDQLNRSRKLIENDMLAQATVDVTSYLQQPEFSPAHGSRPLSLCLFDPDWHQGVIGILASRVKDKINRPTIVFACDNDSTGNNDESLIKGSARSVKGVHIRDALVLVDSRNPGLIEKFGGHAMAAGLSIHQKNYQKFAEEFHFAVETQLAEESIKDEIVTDAGLEENELSLEFAFDLQASGPWGQGFPEPLFDDYFEVVNHRIVGGEHLKLVVKKNDVCLDGIYFRAPQTLQIESGMKVHLVYKLEINEFRDKRTVQLMIEQLVVVK